MRFDNNFTNGTTNSTGTEENSPPQDVLRILVWGQLAITMTSLALNLFSLYRYRLGIAGAKRLSKVTCILTTGGIVSLVADGLNFLKGATVATYVVGAVGGAAFGSVLGGLFGESVWRKKCCGENNPRQIVPVPQR